MEPLPASALSAPCDPATLSFSHTGELEPREEIVGQARALRALDLGLSLRADGFNLFVAGAPRTGKRSILRRLVAARAVSERVPPDLCYVHNFDEPERPLFLRLPPGCGRVARAELERTVTEFTRRLPLAFEGESFAQRAAAVAERAAGDRDRLFEVVEQLVKAAAFRLVQAGGNLDVIAANPDGSAMSEAAFSELPAAARAELDARRRSLQLSLEPHAVRLHEITRAEEQARERLFEETAHDLARVLVIEARARIPEAALPELVRHLVAVERALVLSAAAWLRPDADDEDDDAAEAETAPRTPRNRVRESLLTRCGVHVLVDRAGETGAPVIEESNPTYANLFGRIERRAHLGALETSVAGMRPGALQRASGGYLILDAVALVENEATWAAVKRALRSGEVRLEEDADDRMVVGSLQPESSPLEAKLLLVGPPELYLQLFEEDEAFADLFKVKVELDDTLERTPEHELALARFVAAAARDLGLPPFGADAVARLIEQSSRDARHQRRLSAQLGRLRDLVAEAGHGGRASPAVPISGQDVDRAIEARAERGRLLERTLGRLLDEGVLRVRTEGVETGTANGLAVLTVGDHAFGQVLRVTARARPGRFGLVDIEREVGLGGPSHSKGLLLLSGYLSGRYARETPLALHASIAAEQSHGPIEGDSASLAELCALLSAVSGVPLRQDLAITGAVSQLGEVLAVGDVTIKIEGFFQLCERRGLTGTQGVLVPRSTLSGLMLRRELVLAAQAGRFHVYAVDNVDEALALLTGISSGSQGPDGRFPPGSLNARIVATFERWVERVGPTLGA